MYIAFDNSRINSIETETEKISTEALQQGHQMGLEQFFNENRCNALIEINAGSKLQ